jgi:hypothetical protein
MSVNQRLLTVDQFNKIFAPNFKVEIKKHKRLSDTQAKEYLILYFKKTLGIDEEGNLKEVWCEDCAYPVNSTNAGSVPSTLLARTIKRN